MTDHIPIPPRPNPLSPTAQFMLNAAFHQHQQHDHLNPTPDFRRLCAELVDAFDIPSSFQYKALVLTRARAALAIATPPPEPPTVMEILELSGEIEEAGLGQIDLVRAALERWGK